MIWLVLTTAYLFACFYYRYRALPEGIERPPRAFRVPSEDVMFLYDVSTRDGKRIMQTFRTVLALAKRARTFVLFDFFLFNLNDTHRGDFQPTTKMLAKELMGTDVRAYFITDPVNTAYGTVRCEPLDWLREAGVDVCITDIDRLPDNNVLYAGFWRLFLQWMNVGSSGWIRHPNNPAKRVTLRAFLKALNARANHRKLVVADPGRWVVYVSSSNLEDASCYFANAGVLIRDDAVAKEFLHAEHAVARMSGCSLKIPAMKAPIRDSSTTVTPLWGTYIRRAILADLRSTDRGDSVFVGMLFLSERAVIDELVACAHRGARVTVVLDQNLRSFYRRKGGMPNRPVAWELKRRAPEMEVKWYAHAMEEYHTKMIYIERSVSILHVGSANLTRRGLLGTNLEANVRIRTGKRSGLAREVRSYIDKLVRGCTEEYRPERQFLDYIAYRAGEATGFSTF